MRVAIYKDLPVGAIFKVKRGEMCVSPYVFKKGVCTDFHENGDKVYAEDGLAEVLVVEETEAPAPESIDFRRHAVFELVGDELDAARQNHPPMNSHHEAYGVILEEVDEYWAEVKKKAKDRRPSEVRAELVQIAAMACRAIIDLDLL